MSGDDYEEHWPEQFGSPAKCYKVYQAVEAEAVASRHAQHDEVYRYVPAQPKTEPKMPESNDERLYRYVPAREVKKEPDPAPRYTYVPAPKSKQTPIIWTGRTKAEIAEDNAAIAKAFELKDKPSVGPTGLKDDDVVWMKDTNNELIPHYYATIKNLEGEWKQYADNEERWYFVRA